MTTGESTNVETTELLGTGVPSTVHGRAKKWKSALALVPAAWLIVVLVASFVQFDLRDNRWPTFNFAALLVQAFRFHAGVAIAIVAMCLVRRHRATAAAMLFIAVFSAWPELRHAWPVRGDDPNVGVPVRVISLNNHSSAKNIPSVAAMLTENDPDLVAFQELNPFADALLRNALGDRLPHRLSFESNARPGLALYARRPFRLVLAPARGTDHKRYAIVETEIDGRTVQFVPAHFDTPQSPSLVANNRRGVVDCIERLAPGSVPTIVIGDCNFPLSAQQTEAFRGAGFRHVDDVVGSGLRWTWELKGTLPVTRIDHCFVSPQFGVVASRVLPDVGSDHRPILVDLRLR